MAGAAQPQAQQQEDQRLSITEEMPPAFRYFKRLPIELRLKIWEAACLPSTDADHGLHYVTLDVVEEALKRPCEKSSEATNPNKSAYLWDAGLWLACKESRSVIAKHLDFEGWLAFREQPIEDYLCG
ncbi:hypothetical protein FOC1_g10002123 [Fusarium oxysporum f. sp. cubense race 1]|uniref:2EXR domain-containing protein n=1 Tax=Fusarium oxysporum f. sp. cubense (strain race 1) TaxID=1229664 RepID=N4UP87_FUSC1|nr:hypothetical protein FOC1_g10002123 [Fusarium oxysporum f. sp. cubense race 1]